MSEIKNITKDDILESIKRIDQNRDLRIGRESTHYDLVHNGEEYPPILVLSEANKLAGGEELTLKNFNNNTDKAFSILRSFGFKIVGKTNNETIQQQLITQYKSLVREDQNKPELYKWKLIKEFQEKWDIEADDFVEMLKSLDFRNLLDYRSLTLIKFSEEYVEEVRSLFKMLYDESIPLKKRILEFGERSEKIVKENHPDLGAYQDERTIATYLTFRYPDKYTFYKYSIYSDYADLLEIDKVGVGERYFHYLELIDELIEDYISKDEDLINLSRQTLTSDCYVDSNLNILAQDILFRVTQELNYPSDSEDDLKKIFKELGVNKTTKFFEYLDNIVHQFDLREGDKRIVLSTRTSLGRLSFIIGQRYCLSIESADKNPWRYISLSSESLSKENTAFEGLPNAYYHKTDTDNHVEKELDQIFEACKQELDRTTKSGFSKHNNSSFEKAVFDRKYRDELFSEVFGKSIDNEIMQESFLGTLKSFLEQAKTDNLKTSHYSDSFNGLYVKVSFGQGNTAKIPWVSFLHETQSTSDGIYPVYLLFKKEQILILAFGVSEENEPELSWNLKNSETIKEYFEENDLGKPHRYGSSYIFKVYDLVKPIENYEIESDLYEITNKYKAIMQDYPVEVEPESFVLAAVTDSLEEANLIYRNTLVGRFVVGLATKPFLILTGLSGSGKTKLAQAFSEWITLDESQVNLAPVGADWTNREPLLGYPNALEYESYVLPDSGVLQLVLRAKDNPEKPFFLILDEMNLSHVERYFADFLSAIESEEKIKLHSGSSDWETDGYQIPSTLSIPKNLFIIGTVNIDETTYMFSPKVLDRANVIEFRVSKDELDEFLSKPLNVDLESIDGKGAGMATEFVEIAKNPANEYSNKLQLSGELLNFFEELNDVGAEFGYRTAFEINRFASLSEQLAEDWEFDHIMDAAIAQKLLPKLHGSRRKLERVLIKLGNLCLNEGEAEEFFKKPKDIDYEIVKYPISFEKLVRMHKGLVQNGFTSFAEA